MLLQVKSEFPGVLIIDYTLPTAVNGESAHAFHQASVDCPKHCCKPHEVKQS